LGWREALLTLSAAFIKRLLWLVESGMVGFFFARFSPPSQESRRHLTFIADDALKTDASLNKNNCCHGRRSAKSFFAEHVNCGDARGSHPPIRVCDFPFSTNWTTEYTLLDSPRLTALHMLLSAATTHLVEMND
jgi:hypothetical protein